MAHSSWTLNVFGEALSVTRAPQDSTVPLKIHREMIAALSSLPELLPLIEMIN